jgi:hypothetical protein
MRRTLRCFLEEGRYRLVRDVAATDRFVSVVLPGFAVAVREPFPDSEA